MSSLVLVLGLCYASNSVSIFNSVSIKPSIGNISFNTNLHESSLEFGQSIDINFLGGDILNGLVYQGSFSISNVHWMGWTNESSIDHYFLNEYVLNFSGIKTDGLSTIDYIFTISTNLKFIPMFPIEVVNLPFNFYIQLSLESVNSMPILIVVSSEYLHFFF